MGARDASDAWDLRCHVREELVGYLQREFPQALHRLRTDFTNQMPLLISNLTSPCSTKTLFRLLRSGLGKGDGSARLIRLEAIRVQSFVWATIWDAIIRAVLLEIQPNHQANEYEYLDVHYYVKQRVDFH